MSTLGRTRIPGRHAARAVCFIALAALAFAPLSLGAETSLHPAALLQEEPDTVEHHEEIEHDERAHMVPHDPSVFKADPVYDSLDYDYQAQLDIYGAKHLNRTQRPLLEWGRDLYTRGPFERSPTPLGEHNPVVSQLMVYGDFRTSSAFNDVGAAEDIGTWASRLNLEVDWKLTATERIHAFFRPLDDDGRFTRCDFEGAETGCEEELDAEPDALFFEGDLGAILGGLSGRDAPFDMPIAVGLMPLLFHNGIWLEDAFTGAAFTIPSRNSGALDWSNFDITFFGGWDRLSNPTAGLFRDEDGDESGWIAGTNWFIEAYEGYIEAGYAYVDDESPLDADYHSVAFSWTSRVGNHFSNSVRYMGSIAGDIEIGGVEVEAPNDGHIIFIENSLITSRPYTFLPYFNFFASIDRPVSAVRGAGSGGILRNTGINFESDGLTGFPTINANAPDAFGGAIGLELLGWGNGFGSQFVIEGAVTYPHEKSVELPGGQYAVGARFQKPLNHAIILRLDGMYGVREDGEVDGVPVVLDDVGGVRVEFRWKF